MNLFYNFGMVEIVKLKSKFMHGVMDQNTYVLLKDKFAVIIDAGADIFCFAQDQFARGVQGGALAILGKAAAATVQESNSAGSVAAVTAGDELYAYPLTADNGYFMYYDKTVIQESSVGSLEAIIADCVAADKNFSFELKILGIQLHSSSVQVAILTGKQMIMVILFLSMIHSTQQKVLLLLKI